VVIQKLQKKNFDASGIVEQMISLYKRKNEIQAKADQVKAEMNRLSKRSGTCSARKDKRRDAAKEQTVTLKNAIKQLDDELPPLTNRYSIYRFSSRICRRSVPKAGRRG
jgi:seryl-tRNA synthetase